MIQFIYLFLKILVYSVKLERFAIFKLILETFTLSTLLIIFLMGITDYKSNVYPGKQGIAFMLRPRHIIKL